MSSSWRLLEATPNLLENLSRSLINVADLTHSLEQNGLLSADNVDFVAALVGTAQSNPMHELVKKIVIKDEDSFRRFKRTLIENGEYDAVGIICSALETQASQQQSPPTAAAAATAEEHPTSELTIPISGDLMPPRDQPLRLSLPRHFSTMFSGSGASSRDTDHTADEEVDARPELVASTSTSTTATASPTAMLSVRKAEQINTGPRIYSLTESPRGLCVIFNNQNFPSFHDKNRPGSELDVQRMTILFEEFNFMVFQHVDRTSDEMLSLLDTYANNDVLEGHQAFVLILMSHGELNHIYGNDYMQVKLQDIFEKFNNSNCPALRERPKLFFIQACRGNQPDNGIEGRDPFADIFEDDGIQSDAGVIRNKSQSRVDDEFQLPRLNRRISVWSDMYIAYAVVEGYESLRDRSSGSWFMKAVFDVMARYAHAEDLDTLMERVAQRVLEKARGDGQRQCPEVKKIGWRKKLFFNPGLPKQTGSVLL